MLPWHRTGDQQKLTRPEGGEKKLQRIELVLLALAGFGWVDGATDACREKASKKRRFVSSVVETTLILKLIFKLQSLKTVRMFLEIVSCNFSRKKWC